MMVLPELSVCPDRAGVASHAAALITETLSSAVAHGVAHVALTGGGTGAAVNRVLAGGHLSARVHLWWGDERWVLPDSPERNDLDAQDLAWAGAAVHRAPSPASGLGLEEAAAIWGAEIQTALPSAQGVPVFDAVVLGVGGDGHIASLFPGREELLADRRVVVPVRQSPKPPAERLSLSLPVLQTARLVIFVVSGAEKTRAVQMMRADWESGIPHTPAGMVRGTQRTVLVADRAALGDEIVG